MRVHLAVFVGGPLQTAPISHTAQIGRPQRRLDGLGETRAGNDFALAALPLQGLATGDAFLGSARIDGAASWTPQQTLGDVVRDLTPMQRPAAGCGWKAMPQDVARVIEQI